MGLVQPVVPRYRVPVFNALGADPAVDLTILADTRVRPGRPAPAEGATHYQVEPAFERSLGPFMWQPALVRAARDERFDALVLPWNVRYLHLGRALRTAQRRGVGTILWGHGFSKNESPTRRRLRNRLLQHADACLLYSQGAADRLIEEGLDPARVFVAANAIDQAPVTAATAHWRERPNELAAFQREHGLVAGRTIVFISRLEPDKRLELLLDAFARVAARSEDARLAIIGTGSCLDALRARAAELDLGDRVLFPGAVYDDVDLAPWCLSAGAFAYPVAIGLSIFHAFGYGLPVITSDDLASHNPEIGALRDGENGLVYRDGDVDDFARRILECLDDDSRREQLSRGALATVTGDGGFTIDRMVQGFRDAIDFVVR